MNPEKPAASTSWRRKQPRHVLEKLNQRQRERYALRAALDPEAYDKLLAEQRDRNHRNYRRRTPHELTVRRERAARRRGKEHRPPPETRALYHGWSIIDLNRLQHPTFTIEKPDGSRHYEADAELESDPDAVAAELLLELAIRRL